MSPSENLPVFCIMGPTASGKTRLALDLAHFLPIEVISVDSMMVYKGMDIGTAKPTQDERSVLFHHLVDTRYPAEGYSVATFCQDAEHAIANIRKCNKIPVLVGGTMLYFRALQFGLSPLPETNKEVRVQLQKEAQILGWQHLHKQLRAQDPTAAGRISPNDKQRILRALEIYRITGRKWTDLCTQSARKIANYRFINISLTIPDRKRLGVRITHRFDHMLKKGLVQEVAALKNRGAIKADMSAARSVGYLQVLQYLSREISAEVMRERAIIATRQLAKRQMVWLKKHWPNRHHLVSESEGLVHQVCAIFSRVLKELDRNY